MRNNTERRELETYTDKKRISLKFDLQTLNRNFGERLKGQREKLGLTQKDLAQKIGANKNTIQNYETGSLPKGIFAIRLADFFSCSTDWLLTGNGPAPGIPTPSETPAPPQPASPLDIKLLQRAIFLVEQEIADGELDPAEKAQGIAEVYEALARVRRNTAATDRLTEPAE